MDGRSPARQSRVLSMGRDSDTSFHVPFSKNGQTFAAKVEFPYNGWLTFGYVFSPVWVALRGNHQENLHTFEGVQKRNTPACFQGPFGFSVKCAGPVGVPNREQNNKQTKRLQGLIPIPFNHRSFPTPTVFPRVLGVFFKKDPWKDWKWTVPRCVASHPAAGRRRGARGAALRQLRLHRAGAGRGPRGRSELGRFEGMGMGQIEPPIGP